MKINNNISENLSQTGTERKRKRKIEGWIFRKQLFFFFFLFFLKIKTVSYPEHVDYIEHSPKPSQFLFRVYLAHGVFLFARLRVCVCVRLCVSILFYILFSHFNFRSIFCHKNVRLFSILSKSYNYYVLQIISSNIFCVI